MSKENESLLIDYMFERGFGDYTNNEPDSFQEYDISEIAQNFE